MKLGFVILAHDNPSNAARLARLLLASGSTVAIHFDLKSGEGPITEIKTILGDLAPQLIWPRRIRVNWGEWSIVEATLNSVKAIFDTNVELDYIHLMSAADYPLRPIADFVAFLERHRGADFIESHPIGNNWVKGGLTKERYLYRHFFNFKKHRRLFDLCWRIQSRLGLRKKIPRNLEIHLGSQWCTLTAASWKHVMALGDDRRIRRFFRLSWIPDEMFVQTLLATANRPHSNRHLTLYQFNGSGVPVVYYNNHLQYLLSQPFFFARKLSPYATKLRDGLDVVVQGRGHARSFKDHEIGKLAIDDEASQKRSASRALGARLPGWVNDPGLGDLEWNTRPYVVIWGTSTQELEQVAAIIDHEPGFVCHRFLFAKASIGFAGDRERLAGYTKWDIQLRQHKQSNFLVDIINASPGLTTCFLMRAGEEHNLFNVLRRDKNATLLFLQGGLLRGFVEHHGNVDHAQDGAPTLRQEGVVASHLFADYCDWQAETLAGLTKRLPDDTALKICLDILDPDFQSSLATILHGFGHALPAAGPAERARPSWEFRRPLPMAITRHADAFLATARMAERKRLVVELLSQPKPPYLVVIAVAAADAAAIGRVLSKALFADMATSAGSMSSTVTQLTAEAAGPGQKPKLLVHDLMDLGRLDAVAHDRDARILLVTTSLPRAVLRNRRGAGGLVHPMNARQRERDGEWLDPVAFRQSLSETAGALLHARTRLTKAAGLTMEVDIDHPGWHHALAAFIAGAFRDVGTGPAGLAGEILHDWSRQPEADRQPSIDGYRNGDYIRLIVEQLEAGGYASPDGKPECGELTPLEIGSIMGVVSRRSKDA